MKNLKTDSNRILLIGIGNSGRGDDGLGWVFTEHIGQNEYHFIDREYRYQLQIEDSALICEYDTVIFADASHTELKAGFEIRPCTAASHYFFSSHIQSPETILYLANSLYGKYPDTYTMAISGNDWELKTSLSLTAEKNLHLALDFFNAEFMPSLLQSEPASKKTLTRYMNPIL